MPTAASASAPTAEARSEFEAGLKVAAATRHGDSNDAEIEALTHLAGLAAQLPDPAADLTEALTAAKTAADGDSNDAEIEALWEVAELAAVTFGVDYEAINDAAYAVAYPD